MKTSRSRRGQAAMEYLMTYGWAILIVLAIMGILVYLVKPQQVESCNAATPIQCEPERYSMSHTNGSLTIDLSNIGSVGYYISNTTCGGITSDLSQGTVLEAGGDANVYFNCTNSTNYVPTATPGKDTFHDTVVLNYYPIGSPEFSKTQQIEVVVRYS